MRRLRLAIMAAFFAWGCGGGSDPQPADPPLTDGFAGPPVALAAATDARQIVSDGTTVYFAEFTAGTIRSVPVVGGTATTLASGLAGPVRLAQTSTHVYFSSGRTLMRVPKTGGAAETLATASGTVGDIALDESHVYWTVFGGGDGIMKVPLAGGTATLVASVGAPASIELHGDSVYWGQMDSAPAAQVGVVPKAGGVSTPLLGGLGYVFTLEGDADRLYFRDYVMSSARILSLPYAGGPARELAAGLLSPRAVAIDALNVYWVDGNAGTIHAVRKSGGTIRTLASGQAGVIFIGLDAHAAYWVANGQLMKLAR